MLRLWVNKITTACIFVLVVICSYIGNKIKTVN